MAGVLLFDGECGFCTASATWLRRHAVSEARVVPWQHAEPASFGLTAEECAEALQWVDDGQRASGPDAIAAYLKTSTPPWRTAGRLLTVPVTRRVAWPVYRWVAGHRGRLPGATPAVAGPPAPASVKGIRGRRPKDLAACARLLRVVYSEGQYPVRWPEAPRAWLDGEDVLAAWVADRLGEILGHVAVSKVGLDSRSAVRWREITGHEPSELCGVSRLFVRPRVRGQGIGTALVEVAVADIRARGLTPVVEVVSASTDAIRLYEHLGWRLLAMDAWPEEPDGLLVHRYAAPSADTDHQAGAGQARST